MNDNETRMTPEQAAKTFEPWGFTHLLMETVPGAPQARRAST